MRKAIVLVSGWVFVAAAGYAVANPSYQNYSASVSLATTDWTSSIVLPRFNPSFGTLTDIQITLKGHVEGLAAYENLDGPDATVIMHLKSEITLSRPDGGGQILQVAPYSDIRVDGVPTFDDEIDYAGISGHTYSDLSMDLWANTSSPPPTDDLTLFTGIGNIVLPVSAQGSSTYEGPASVAFLFLTKAKAEATVTYEYEPIPAPSSLALAAVGLVGIVLVFRTASGRRPFPK